VGYIAFASALMGLSAGTAPGGAVTFLVPEKSPKERPHVPAFGLAAQKSPARLATGGLAQTRYAALRSNTRKPFSPVPPLLGRSRGENVRSNRNSAFRQPAFHPHLPRRASQQRRDQPRGCLSEAQRSEFPRGPSAARSAGHPAQRGAAVGQVSLVTFFSAKESHCPAGGSPGRQAHQGERERDVTHRRYALLVGGDRCAPSTLLLWDLPAPRRARARPTA
jgi:hypothetical protein